MRRRLPMPRTLADCAERGKSGERAKSKNIRLERTRRRIFTECSFLHGLFIEAMPRDMDGCIIPLIFLFGRLFML
jgi:hypothetical protein